MDKKVTTKTNYAGKQPRIDTAEKQRAAQNPRPFQNDERELHPGEPGQADVSRESERPY